MLRYSVLRLLIFFGVLSLLWLLGLRDPDQQWMLLVASALISMVLSYFVLARFREESTRALAERVERRMEAKQAGPGAGAGAGSSASTGSPVGTVAGAGAGAGAGGAKVRGRDEVAEDLEDEAGPAEYR